MIYYYYLILFCISALLTTAYVTMWHKHFNMNMTIIFALMPVGCMGYVMLSGAQNIREAIVAQKLVYLIGDFIQFFIFFCICDLCRVEIKRWARMLLFLTCVVLFGGVTTIGRNALFYNEMTLDVIDGAAFFRKTYGPLHTAFYVGVALFFAAELFIIIYSRFKNKLVSRRMIWLLTLPDVVAVATFMLRAVLRADIELIPAMYCVGQLILIIVVYRVNLYDISGIAIESYSKEQEIAYICFDYKRRYLGCNKKALELLPEFGRRRIDEPLGDDPIDKRIGHYLDAFSNEEDPTQNFVFMLHNDPRNPEDDEFYNVKVNYIYDGSRKRGYILSFTDDTLNRKYIRLLDSYNDNLKKEVDAKTQRLNEMHDNLVISMASLVESRDNSTGGHIKRTSIGVKILIDEIHKSGKFNLTDEFRQAVIKAAPMHDLGKIAVDDDILKKPGKYTVEEYEKMKKHAEEGAKVIHEVLLNTDDETFKVVAENVAHYHHERWDGSGYPDGLSGEAIPLEARIMAIADVYDALVSKRVYKEAYDYKKANRIITEAMGSQFDPGLQEIFDRARPRLEEYYRTANVL